MSKLHALDYEDADGTWRLMCGLAIPPDAKRGDVELDRLEALDRLGAKGFALDVCRACARWLDKQSNREIARMNR